MDQPTGDNHYQYLRLEDFAPRGAVTIAVDRKGRQADSLAESDPTQATAIRERVARIREDLLTSDERRATYDDALRAAKGITASRVTKSAGGPVRAYRKGQSPASTRTGKSVSGKGKTPAGPPWPRIVGAVVAIGALIVVAVIIATQVGNKAAAPAPTVTPTLAVPTPTPAPTAIPTESGVGTNTPCVNKVLSQQAASATGTYGTTPPKMSINTSCKYTATINTSKGPIVVGLLPGSAPVTVNSFIFLARHNYYAGNKFYRVVPKFMLQTGDPNGQSGLGPGYHYQVESPGSSFPPGTLAMANTGAPDSNQSQFFICQGPQCSVLSQSAPPSGVGYTVFGHVIRGLSVVNAIANSHKVINPTDTIDLNQTTGQKIPTVPVPPIFMTSITVTESK